MSETQFVWMINPQVVILEHHEDLAGDIAHTSSIDLFQHLHVRVWYGMPILPYTVRARKKM